MKRIILPSPAKLNLYLKVLNKRPDGFHNISTVFERINLNDEISFRSLPQGGIRVICPHPHVPTGPKNLVYQVAQSFKKDFQIREGVEITIKKNIPVAAGLAGGSSNAATAILGLQQLWKLDLNQAQKLAYARKIGSDVAFFTYNTSWAYGSGRGDIIKKLDISARLWHILVVPKVKMYSWKVYGGLKMQLTHSGSTMPDSTMPVLNTPKAEKAGRTNMLTKIDDNANILIRNLKKDNVLEASRQIVNDLEKVVVRLCPRLRTLKERLKSLNTLGVIVSGSGPSVFGVTATQKEAEQIKIILSKRFSQVFVVRTH